MNRIAPKRGRQPDPAARAERREQILRAAETCFVRKGFHAATTAEISAEAQISVAGLYQHFPSKNDLILALIEKDLQASISVLEKVAGESDFFSAVQRQMTAAIEAALADNSARIRLEIIAEATRSPVVAAMLAEADTKLVAAVTKLFADAQARGHANPDLDPRAVALAATCLIDGLTGRLSFAQGVHKDLLDACVGLLSLTLEPAVSN